MKRYILSFAFACIAAAQSAGAIQFHAAAPFHAAGVLFPAGVHTIRIMPTGGSTQLLQIDSASGPRAVALAEPVTNSGKEAPTANKIVIKQEEDGNHLVSVWFAGQSSALLLQNAK